MNHVLGWLLDAGTALGLLLLALCILYGLLLLVAPAMALAASRRMNEERSTRRALRPLEIPRYVERFFYRHHRAFGVLLLLGVAAFYLIYFLDFPEDSLLASLSATTHRALADVLIDSVTRFLLVANAAIAVFALVMLFRPSLLKPVEAWANRWLSTRRVTRSAEAAHDGVDRLVERHPRAAGGLILAGGLYILFALAVAMG